MNKIDRQSYICPECREVHKLNKIKGDTIIFIKCRCRVGALIQVKDGCYIPSKMNMSKIEIV